MKNCIFPDCKSRQSRLFFFVQVFLHCNCFCKFCILNVYRLTQWRTGNPRPTKSRPRVKGSGFNFARRSKSPFEVWLRTRSASYKQQYNDFNSLIPNTVTEIVFTDEVKPKDKATIDVDADGDGGVVAWLDDDARTVMKVSTQIPGVKVQAAKDSENMFFNRSKLQKIDFKMLDTQNVTDMSGMFYKCSGLTSLDLTPLDTQNVTNMRDLFGLCSGLTSLDLSPLDTQNVTDMSYMFYHCFGLSTAVMSISGTFSPFSK